MEMSQSEQEQEQQAMAGIEQQEELTELPPTKKPRTSDETAEPVYTAFVGNLPYSMTSEALEIMFGQFGEVRQVKIGTDHETNEPKGYAYIDFASLESKNKAIEQSGKHDVDGRKLFIEDKQSKSTAGSTPKKLKDDQMADNSPSTVVFLGNLAFDTTEDAIKQAFEDCGGIASVRIPKHNESFEPRGFAYVEFGSLEASAKAKELDGLELDGRQIRVNYASPLSDAAKDKKNRRKTGGRRQSRGYRTRRRNAHGTRGKAQAKD
ncbi:nuclear localization sequence binding protein [Dipsacomyces acuminosporus]|nr:nuclear localization sequence binding protein [Dipsacomyces acuminosporus]